MKREDLEKFIEENQDVINPIYEKIVTKGAASILYFELEESFNNICRSSIDYKDIINFHTSVAMEECGELIQAISKVRRAEITNLDRYHTKELKQNLQEEMADVILNIYRLCEILNLNVSDIDRILAAKLFRYRKYSEKCLEEGKL